MVQVRGIQQVFLDDNVVNDDGSDLKIVDCRDLVDDPMGFSEVVDIHCATANAVLAVLKENYFYDMVKGCCAAQAPDFTSGLSEEGPEDNSQAGDQSPTSARLSLTRTGSTEKGGFPSCIEVTDSRRGPSSLQLDNEVDLRR